MTTHQQLESAKAQLAHLFAECCELSDVAAAWRKKYDDATLAWSQQAHEVKRLETELEIENRVNERLKTEIA